MDAGDAYVCHVSLKDKDVIFTDRFLAIANRATGAEWKHPWRDIAWCELSDFGGVLIHLYKDDPSAAAGGGGNKTLLAVEDADEAYEIYELVGGGREWEMEWMRWWYRYLFWGGADTI